MKKEKVILYDQELNPKDIWIYLPGSLNKKLSNRDKRLIEDALFKVVVAYKDRYDELYLNKMLI